METCSASKWTVGQVSDWLTLLELPQYKSKFESLGIDGGLLLQITEDDLSNDFQVKIRLHRHKILENLKKLKEEQPKSESECSDSDCSWNSMILKAVEGQCKYKIFEITHTGASIGRNSGSNNYVINESFVSRKHCEIMYNQLTNQFLLRDVGSTTGTFIMISKKLKLDQGFMFQMGLSEFRVTNIRHTPFGIPVEMTIAGYEGPARDSEYNLDRNGGIIGRDSENSVAIVDDSQLSAKHGHIFFENNGFYVEDLGSTNKTWRRISPEGDTSKEFPIYLDDFIKIGSTLLQVAVPEECENKENIAMPAECRICNEAEPNTLCYPCGHLFCSECLKTITKCPNCFKEISDKVKVFK